MLPISFIISFSILVFSSATSERFHEWAAHHNIQLPSDSDSYYHMFDTWHANDRIIEKTNSQNLSYSLGHNQFSALTSAEFSNLIGFNYNRKMIQSNIISTEWKDSLISLPASVDWRSKGAVTPVKDQQSCGSCWSFSTTGALEGAFAIKTGNLVSFSEQELVDCDYIKNGGSSLGCNGGDMASAMKWIGKNNGLCSESSYPYVSGETHTNGPCQHTCSNVAGSDVISVSSVPPKSESAMMSALVKNPVSVAIEADQSSFQLYKSGVFTGACGTNLDHGVLLVGYDSESWIMKNSWSSDWGEGGFMRMGRGNYNDGAGQCGVLLDGVFPIL